jgi:hypothetical protein
MFGKEKPPERWSKHDFAHRLDSLVNDARGAGVFVPDIIARLDHAVQNLRIQRALNGSPDARI